MKNLEFFQDSINSLYKFMQEELGNNTILSVSPFPMLGVGKDYFYASQELKDFYNQNKMEFDLEMDNIYTNSDYVNDFIINSHPRFGNLSRNIRYRRGNKVDIKIPIFEDVNTNITEPTNDEPYPGFIYMDAMGFGMGNTCFQVTLGSCTLKNALYLYDQLIPLTPILV